MQSFHSWIRSSLEVNPFSVEACISKGKRLHWPLPSVAEETNRNRPQDDGVDFSNSGNETHKSASQASNKERQNRQRIVTTANMLPRGDTSKG